MNKQIIITASVFGVLAVMAGAFGAHGLKTLIEPQQLAVWHTAVEYNFYHVFALLFLSTFGQNKSKFISASYYLFTFGIIFFSGSLYLLACRDLLNMSWLWIMGPITPVGGLLFMAGWITLALAAMRGK
ncbi:DUF423 domain-containing protein [Mucilaginibacter sp.]|uniref:DUF423 domain-containing protein n=1 Tax=Mucilaginibacter sp. TaxID=1882438 RepID=UPI002625D2EE|nr:DUF423 domain-containing protein [Mucilaginibacter sp.]MDB5032252.1 hypothetical protein [Mucilaginibacter sp.]